jgi:hypothetical protein
VRVGSKVLPAEAAAVRLWLRYLIHSDHSLAGSSLCVSLLNCFAHNAHSRV